MKLPTKQEIQKLSPNGNYSQALKRRKNRLLRKATKDMRCQSGCPNKTSMWNPQEKDGGMKAQSQERIGSENVRGDPSNLQTKRKAQDHQLSARLIHLQLHQQDRLK